MNIVRETESGTLLIEFEPVEASVFTDTVGLVGSLIDLARHDEQMPDLASDPALRRLFPEAYADPEAEDEFRRFTREELVDLKLDDSFTVLTAFQNASAWPSVPTDHSVVIRVPAGEVVGWLRTITNLRLTLDARISQEPSTLSAPLDHEDVDHFRRVYEWLGYMQESLIEAADA